MHKRSLIPIGAIMIVVCFFLPWIKACDIGLTGVQLASDTDSGDPIFWLILGGGIASLLGYILLKNLAKAIAFLGSCLSLLILIVKLFIPYSKGEFRGMGLTIEPGGFGLLVGLILSIAGALVKAVQEPPQELGSKPPSAVGSS